MNFNTEKWRRIVKGILLLLTVYAIFTITPNKYYMLTGLSIALIVTILFRTVFCGWICFLGTVFDLIRSVGKWFGSISVAKPINRKYKRWVKNNKIVLGRIDHYARYFRYVLLLWILQAAFLGIASIKDGDERGIVSVLFLLIALAVLGLFVERSWCKYSCPVGAVLGVFSKISPTSVTRNESGCIDCNICSRICPMNIDVANLKRVSEIDCQTCVQCVEACPEDDALDLKTNIPGFRKAGTATEEIDYGNSLMPAPLSKFTNALNEVNEN